MTQLPMTRRTFLRRSAAAAGVAAGLAGGISTQPLFAAASGCSDPMDRIALTTVSFRFRFPATRPDDYAGTEGLLRLRDVPVFFADRFGVHNVELWSLHFESTDPAYLNDVKKAISEAGSRLINIQIDHPYNLAADDEHVRRESMALVRRWIDVAQTLGAPSVRANTGSGTIETSVASLSALNDYAAERGILLLTENHGGISTDVDVLLEILNRIPSDNFRAVADFGNFPDGADRYGALVRLIPHTHLISAKTQVYDEAGRHVSFDYDRCIQEAERAGFQGIYSAEQWDPSTDPLDAEYAAQWMIERLKANLGS